MTFLPSLSINLMLMQLKAYASRTLLEAHVFRAFFYAGGQPATSDTYMESFHLHDVVRTFDACVSKHCVCRAQGLRVNRQITYTMDDRMALNVGVGGGGCKDQLK